MCYDSDPSSTANVSEILGERHYKVQVIIFKCYRSRRHNCGARGSWGASEQLLPAKKKLINRRYYRISL